METAWRRRGDSKDMTKLKRKNLASKLLARSLGLASEKQASGARSSDPTGRNPGVGGEMATDTNRLVWDIEYRDEVRKRLKIDH